MSFSSPPSSSTTATTPAADAMQEESQKRDDPATKEKEMVHKTKVIQFLGRTTPIILQNDNGPCPLLAICKPPSLSPRVFVHTHAQISKFVSHVDFFFLFYSLVVHYVIVLCF